MVLMGKDWKAFAVGGLHVLPQLLLVVVVGGWCRVEGWELHSSCCGCAHL
jgi:hypothetical protein